ncbi:MAG: ATP-dependent helicase, partial [Planctomycetota bacterium]|nr:ATP-dependent helicase [Planctomycetota bacterium]
MGKRFVPKSAKGKYWEECFKESLNEEQYAAATAPFSPVLIIAGAGTGKTHTLTHRVAYLLAQDIPAPRIMLATFTNRAAREMLSRVRHIIGAEAELVIGGTFHHISNLLLRRYAHSIGFPSNYTILDSEDSEDLIAQCRADAGINLSEKLFPSKSVLKEIFSSAANRLHTVEQTVKEEFPQLVEYLETIEEIRMRYEKRKRELAVMDYDDLLIHLLTILENRGSEWRAITDSFSAVLVDEYQDTNALQGKIVDILCENHRNLTVVGDDAQSIYSFRGAEFRNIITFPERYPDCRTYYLTINYRSTPQILNFTNASIANNLKQFKKELKPSRPDGIAPVVLCCEDSIQQAETVAERILQLNEEGIPLSEIGVLYRAHWNSMELQMELAKRRIPFEVRSGLRFFERAHIKDACAFLRIVTNV